MSRTARSWIIVTSIVVTISTVLAGIFLLTNGRAVSAQEQSINGVRLVDASTVASQAHPVSRVAQLETVPTGMLPVRLRNNATSVAARFNYIPGASKYNDWVNNKVWQVIRETGIPYKAQAQAVGAGFSDRGCVQGSSLWPAADLLARPATGPLGGSGTAIVCDVTAAYGSQIEITLRVVTGTPASISRDEATSVIIDSASNDMSLSADQWTAAAATELWNDATYLLGLKRSSNTENSFRTPADDQLALVKSALDQSQSTAWGDVIVDIAPGLTIPTRNSEPPATTTESTTVSIDQQTARSWMTPHQLAISTDHGKPFIGITAPLSAANIDCALVPCVALTYDDGPTTYSPTLLDTFKAQNASATFFMIGLNVVKYPDFVRRASAEGHDIGSHTYDHRDLTKLSVADARTQVLSAAEAITKITGKPVSIFRAPYGSVTQPAITAIGMPAINWNVDTGDWTTPGQAAVISRSVPVAKADSIILMHEIRNDTVQVAKTIIQGMRDRGLEPVTISQLFGSRIPLENLREVKR